MLSFFNKKIRRSTKVFNKTFEEFKQTGVTPQEGHTALIDLFCRTNGKFNDTINNKIIKSAPKTNPTSTSKLWNSIDRNYSNELNNKLEKNGYVDFKETLPKELVDKIYNFALKNETRMAPNYDKKVLFDPTNFQSEIYRFDANDLANSIEIQELIMDPFLIDVARKYLKSEPIFDFPAMWWSTSFLKEASAEAAQLYHFDLDRIKWLKIFFYITDVNENTGPHCYIEGSHISGTKPKEILKKGYARIQDEELEKYYPKDKFKTICAPAGSIFAGDTKCWHKGTPLKEGVRLVLEFEYTTSLFGANYDKFIMKNYTPEFKEFCKNNSYYSSNFIFE